MKSMSRLKFGAMAGLLILLGTLGNLLLPVPKTHAQQASVPTAVQQSTTRADAAVFAQTSATSAATITITPPGGQSVYITEIDITNCAGGTAVTAAAPTTLTTTNITGSPAWTIGSGVTAGQCTQVMSTQYPTGLKATSPGTNVTLVLPTFATNQTVRVNVAGFYGQ